MRRLTSAYRNMSWYNIPMKLSALILLPMVAFGVAVESLPPPQFIDTEVSATRRLEQPHVVNFLDFSLAFNGTASNNVEVAFGCDADGDDKLAVHETELIVGWRCGRYFIENFRTGETVEETNVGTNGVARSFDWHYRVRGNKTIVRSFTATNEAGAAFLGLTATKPAWLYGGNWNLMRMVARGVDVQDEHFEVDVRARGFHINLR